MDLSALSIKNLTKVYSNGFKALHGINLEIPHGDFFALLGPNGAGKSTTIGIITSLIKKTSGDICIYGIDIDKDFVSAKKNIGLVPQEINFNTFEPIIEIVTNQAGYYGVPRDISYPEAKKLLKKLGLWDKRQQFSRKLSGGMQRRLMVARALIHKPKLLILDEPTAGADVEVRRLMWDYLKQLNDNGTTIILTTHYLEEAENLCKNIAIIDDGKILENSSMKDFLSQLKNEKFIFYTDNKIENNLYLKDKGFKIIDDTSIEVSLSSDSDINTLINELSNNGIKVKSLKNKTNRLEELFMRLVDKNGK
jgi:ABC-2 type transport system ATP-binding protein|tara:strand:+ start:479 stop:1402 length:924 start_codon:yes stop_codon:yes gene_type:complete